MDSPVVYDKGKYHDETVMKGNLPEERASVHTAFFLGWLIENNLCSDEFKSESDELIAQYKNRAKTAVQVYEWWDRCLIDDMLSDEGNRNYMDGHSRNYMDGHSKRSRNYMDGHSKRRNLDFLFKITPVELVGLADL